MDTHQEGTGSVRFVSVLDFSRINRFGSVRFGKTTISWFDAVRPVFLKHVIVRFGSVRFRVRFQPVPELLTVPEKGYGKRGMHFK